MLSRTIIIFALIITFISCSKEKINSERTERWRLTLYQSGFLNVSNLDAEDVVWTIDYETNILTIDNSIHAMYPSTVPSGSYSFTFENNAFTFENNGLIYSSDFTLSENSTVLTLYFDIIPEAVDDEQTYVFERI